MTHSFVRSPLKYPGAKFKVLPRICKFLPKTQIPLFIDCFVGGGSVFMNVKAKRTVAFDINHDLINFYKHVQVGGEAYIHDAKKLFIPSNNTAEKYYQIRAAFNESEDKYERALYMLYLSRHGYNGLWRVSKNGFNVPFGKVKPYFPEQELRALAERSKTVEFIQGDFSLAFDYAINANIKDTFMYSDSPYVAISKTANFTSYTVDGFSHADQLRLVDCMKQSSAHGITNLASNHHNKISRALYKGASKRTVFDVSRTISQKVTERKPVKEVLVLYLPTNNV